MNFVFPAHVSHFGAEELQTSKMMRRPDKRSQTRAGLAARGEARDSWGRPGGAKNQTQNMTSGRNSKWIKEINRTYHNHFIKLQLMPNIFPYPLAGIHLVDRSYSVYVRSPVKRSHWCSLQCNSLVDAVAEILRKWHHARDTRFRSGQSSMLMAWASDGNGQSEVQQSYNYVRKRGQKSEVPA